jgi:glycosyltransferase involved in cell wall biosynthesis
MKLIIQIPCWNEEKSIADTIRSLPTGMAGVDCIEIIVIDDGSIDNTVAEARRAGATEVVSLPRHMGLARAFSKGVEAAIERGADILVNTDGDLQYPSDRIPDLIAPILSNTCDIAIGDRLSYKPSPFSPVKMLFERFGTRMIRFFSRTRVKDAASGFRAFNREAMYSMVIHDEFSYTLESLLLAGAKKLRIANITIPTNKPKRKSRLFQSVSFYIMRSLVTIIRIYLMYHPLRFFVSIGIILITLAFFIGIRFLYFYITTGGMGHIQSLILLVVFTGAGFQSIMLGLLADVVAANRRLLEQIRLKQLDREDGAG